MSRNRSMRLTVRKRVSDMSCRTGDKNGQRLKQTLKELTSQGPRLASNCTWKRLKGSATVNYWVS